MNRFILLTILVMSGWSLSSFAQEPNVELVDYFTANEHNFRCDFSKTVLEELKNQDDSEIEKGIQLELQNIEETLLDPNRELLHTSIIKR